MAVARISKRVEVLRYLIDIADGLVSPRKTIISPEL
jgi:hypothetical protein